MPTDVRRYASILLLLAFALLAGERTPARTSAPDELALRFVPAATLLAEIRAAAPRSGVSTVNYLDLATASAVVVRRTSPAKAEFHKDVVDLLYVVEGGGTLVTGGALSEPVQSEPTGTKWQTAANAPNELRSAGIAGGETRHLGKGDFVVIPASTPHWVSAVENEIVYLAVKVPQGR
jgi:mannose-6-phosphate isomerase-like protein (cupin superfamily)